MVGNIICPVQFEKPEPFDPDSIFDPTTHTATEENFIKLLEHGVYDSKYIGYFVTLSNSVDYNGGKWIIADVNHDSTNTGQSNCYDLISVDCFNSYYMNISWRDSSSRTWLNNTFYPGFSNEFKNHILNPKYKSQGAWYTDDKIILLSQSEINGGSSSYASVEGIKYPIFTGDTTRIKYEFGTSTSRDWWLRTRYTSGSYNVWNVRSDGSLGAGNTNYHMYYLAPLMRVQ